MVVLGSTASQLFMSQLANHYMEEPMVPEDTSAERELHRKFAVNLFNLVWDLLDKKDRTVEENDRMLHAAHASRFHWGEIGTPLELERGEWQVARVNAVLGRPEAALYHAQRCLEICTENGFGDFDLAFAYEALARAYAAAGAPDESRRYFKLAEEAGVLIAKKEDQDYFTSELRTIDQVSE